MSIARRIDLIFPLNSWVTQSFAQWNADRFTWRRPWLDRLLQGLRLFNRLRLLARRLGLGQQERTPAKNLLPLNTKMPQLALAFLLL